MDNKARVNAYSLFIFCNTLDVWKALGLTPILGGGQKVCPLPLSMAH